MIHTVLSASDDNTLTLKKQYSARLTPMFGFLKSSRIYSIFYSLKSYNEPKHRCSERKRAQQNWIDDHYSFGQRFVTNTSSEYMESHEYGQVKPGDIKAGKRFHLNEVQNEDSHEYDDRSSDRFLSCKYIDKINLEV